MSLEDINVDSNAGTLLEMANLAKLCIWLSQANAASYSRADSKLLTIFNCQVSDLPIGPADLYLGIKTQNCIQQLINKTEEQQVEQLITQALTQGLGDKLKAQHPGDDLHNADQAFIALATKRKNELIAETKGAIDSESLNKRYPADELLRSFAAYVKTRLAAVSDIGSVYGVHMHLEVDSTESVTFGDLGGSADLDLDDLSSFFEKTASGLVQDALAGLTEAEATPSIVIDAPDDSNATNGTTGTTVTTGADGANDANGASGANGANGANSANGANDTNGTDKPATAAGTGTIPATGRIDLMTDYKELEALVAESTSNYVKTTLNGLSPVPYQPTVPTSTTESMASQLPFLSHLQQQNGQHHYYSYSQPQPIQEQPPQQPASGENLPPNQTCPSAMLYDKARQAALSKSSAHTRREGLHSTRRPWTQEEEKALMAGLDMVKGPHWSQILTLFGQSGTISDILKDRTQVQLKDKARNLKLFFLKTNSEMPYYLQAVTGELKTRAPTQAARKEAEERARMNSEEDQARLQGIMTLAGGLQHSPQGRTGAAGVGSGVVTPAQAASAAQAAQARATASMANIPRTVAATIAQAQARQGQHSATQQTLQAMPQQNPPRPQGQAQLPPHVPRPQSQQAQQHLPQQQAQQRPQPVVHQQMPQPQHQQHQQPHTQHQHQPQQPKAMAQPPPVQPAVPPPHPIALPRTTSAQHSTTHTPSATASPAPAHTSQPHTPVLQHTPQTVQGTPVLAAKEPPKPEEPLSLEAQQEAENAAEAALLEGLQAAVAEALG